MSSWPQLFRLAANGKFIPSKFEQSIDELEVRTTHKSTPLHFAIIGGNIDIIKFLISQGCNVNSVNKFGETPLHWACKLGTIEMVNILIANGAKINPKDGERSTPLHWAVEYENMEICKMLLEHNASLSTKDNNNRTPMQLAKFNKSRKVVMLIHKFM